MLLPRNNAFGMVIFYKWERSAARKSVARELLSPQHEAYNRYRRTAEGQNEGSQRSGEAKLGRKHHRHTKRDNPHFFGHAYSLLRLDNYHKFAAALFRHQMFDHLVDCAYDGFLM